MSIRSSKPSAARDRRAKMFSPRRKPRDRMDRQTLKAGESLAMTADYRRLAPTHVGRNGQSFMSSIVPSRLLDQIRTRRIRIGVIGLGYVGLSLAVEFARNGVSTTGIDLDSGKVEAINAGLSY